MQKGTRSPFILMLEDDKEDRYITESFFRERGHAVRLEFLTHGSEVIKYLQSCQAKGSEHPHLIILDKNVPTGSGMETLRELKSHPVFKLIPAVMISGSAFQDEVAESYRLGVNSYILKPSTNQLTLKKIETFFDYWFSTVELPGVTEEKHQNFFQ